MARLMCVTVWTITALYSSGTAVGTAPDDDECVNYTTLHSADRSRYFSNLNISANDTSLQGWFRFNGSAGTQIATTCVAANHCGSLHPGWMNGDHPSVADGAVSRLLCISRRQMCCQLRYSMKVRNCNGFHVYKLDGVPMNLSLQFRVCGDNIRGKPEFTKLVSNDTVGNIGDECFNYKQLSERDRAEAFFNYNLLKCDSRLPLTWYRFTGHAGTKMPTHCVPKLHCGTLCPGWLNGLHPTVDDGIVKRMVCFTKDDDCCFWYSDVDVRNCGDFFVYKFGQFPVFGHKCSLRYCGTGKTGCTDSSGNIYEIGETWNPNKLFQCTCKPHSKVRCSEVSYGCWDIQGNAFAEGQEWLKDSFTKCTCSNRRITCVKSSRAACVDENNQIRQHGSQWFPSPCFNCSCADGHVICVKYHVKVGYGYFGLNDVGSCRPCRHPHQDILPSGNGTISACKVFFSLMNSNELSRCSNGDYVRKSHLCNGIHECADGSDEQGCDNSVCKDEDGGLLVLKEEWQVTDCLTCNCRDGYLQCVRNLRVNFPGRRFGYVPFTEECKQPECHIVDFINTKQRGCEAIETTEGGHIVMERSTWTFQGCKFYFPGPEPSMGCPSMKMRACYMYNGAICCAQPCPALSQLSSLVRWGMSLCPDRLQLTVNNDKCDTPSPNCVNQSEGCKTSSMCQDEGGNFYFEGVTWSVGKCIKCECTRNASIFCSRDLKMLTSDGTKTEFCQQPRCNVTVFTTSQRDVCKACQWKNQTFYDGDRWTENGVDFFCSSKRRVRPGCYLEEDYVLCTGAFKGIQNLSLISEDDLFLCESGDEIRPLNDHCDIITHCFDDSDERACLHYYCPSHMKFGLRWERTQVGSVVYRNCSEIDPILGGTFSRLCFSNAFYTEWNNKESCKCEVQSLLQEYTMKISLVNSSNLSELAEELKNMSKNFTNKEVLFEFVSQLFYTGERLLSPLKQENDLQALKFIQTIYSMLDYSGTFSGSADSFCPQYVHPVTIYHLKTTIAIFASRAPNTTLTYTIYGIKWPPPPAPAITNPLPLHRPLENVEHTPGMVVFWRPVLRLNIDSVQLNSRLTPPDGQTSNNSSDKVNETAIREEFLGNANCSWVEFDENGTAHIQARQLRDKSHDKSIVQGYVELVLSSISTVAVILSLIMLSCLRLRNSERIFVHKNLLLSLCLVYIVMILDTFVLTDRKRRPTLCSFMAVTQHFMHTAIFSWMLVEGIHLYIKLVKVFSVKKLYITYVLIGWGIPIAVVGLIAAVRPHTYDMSVTYHKDVMCGSLKLTAEVVHTRCWLQDGEWLYKGPILVILVVNLLIFVILLRVIFTKISKKYGADHVERTRRGFKSVAALLPLLGVTWLLGYVVHLSEVLLYIFIILNSTQGLAFCVFHSLLDDQIKEGIRRSLQKSKMKRTCINKKGSVVSTTTQISPPGSVAEKDRSKQRKDLSSLHALDTKL